MYCMPIATLNQNKLSRLLLLSFSFTILKVFENKKGIIKLLVYSFVIDINQMEVIFATIITGS